MSGRGHLGHTEPPGWSAGGPSRPWRGRASVQFQSKTLLTVHAAGARSMAAVSAGRAPRRARSWRREGDEERELTHGCMVLPGGGFVNLLRLISSETKRGDATPGIVNNADALLDSGGLIPVLSQSSIFGAKSINRVSENSTTYRLQTLNNCDRTRWTPHRLRLPATPGPWPTAKCGVSAEKPGKVATAVQHPDNINATLARRRR